MSTGGPPDLTPSPRGCATMRVLRTEATGKLIAIHGLAQVHALPEVVDLILASRPGHHVEPYHRAGAKLGYLLVSAPDHERRRTVVAEVDALLRFEVEPSP
jgi:hypothetical protein